MGADPGSLDAEVAQMLYFQLQGEEEWRSMSEREVLQAYAASTVPAATRFRRGEQGAPRTLATLMDWNGPACPFANFAEPERRAGVREGKRKEEEREDGRDLNGNNGGRGGKQQASQSHHGSGHPPPSPPAIIAAAAAAAGAADERAIVDKCVQYMDSIQTRLASIERLHMEQQDRLAGAEIFMKKVAMLERRLSTLEVIEKDNESNFNALHQYAYFGKNSPLGTRNILHSPELTEIQQAAKRAYEQMLERTRDLAEYKKETERLHEREKETRKEMEKLDARYAQILAALGAHERNEDVREAIEEANEKLVQRLQQQQQEKFTDLRKPGKVYPDPYQPRSPPKQQLAGFGTPGSRATISTLEKQELQLQQLKLQYSSPEPLLPVNWRDKRAASIDRRSAGTVRPVGRGAYEPGLYNRYKHTDKEVESRTRGLLEGREQPTVAGEQRATEASQSLLCSIAKELKGAQTSTLTKYLQNPKFRCTCGKQIESGAPLIIHIFTANHESKREFPVYQSDVDFFIKLVTLLRNLPTITQAQIELAM